MSLRGVPVHRLPAERTVPIVGGLLSPGRPHRVSRGGEVRTLPVLGVIVPLRLLLPHLHLRHLPGLPHRGVELVGAVGERSDVTDGGRPPEAWSSRSSPGARSAELHAAPAGGEGACAAEVFLQPTVRVVERPSAGLVVSHQEGPVLPPGPAGSARLEQELRVVHSVNLFRLRHVVRTLSDPHTHALQLVSQSLSRSRQASPRSCGS